MSTRFPRCVVVAIALLASAAAPPVSAQAPPAAAGRTFYVAPTGNDGGDGSAAAPWKTISRAMDADLQPGDEVVVRPGTYRERVYIDEGGSPEGYVTLRSEVPGQALIRPPAGAWTTVQLRADYVVVDGFDVVGGEGHAIDAEHVAHTKVLNNVVHDSGASGIGYAWSEFIHIEGNVAYGNAWSDWYSGISVYQSRNITGDTETGGFRTVIKNNVSYGNITQSGSHTDGNGIIIDDFQSTQTSGYPNYTYPTLVEGNLVYGNGGKGIQVTWSDNVTVRNNTAYHNNLDANNDGTWRGELSNAQSSHNVWANNVAVADPSEHPDNRAVDNTSYGGYVNADVVWSNNLTFDGTPGRASVRTDGGNAAPAAADGNLLGVDPQFVGAPGDFRLTAGSPAVDAGTDRFGLAPVDLDGNGRVVGAVDLGAYEFGSAPLGPGPVAWLPEAGTPYQLRHVGTGRVLDTQPNRVVRTSTGNGPDRRWQFVAAGDGRYWVVNEKAGRGALGASPGGAVRWLKSASPDGDDKRWAVEPVADGGGAVRLRNAQDGRGWLAGFADGSVRWTLDAGAATAWEPVALEPLSGPARASAEAQAEAEEAGEQSALAEGGLAPGLGTPYPSPSAGAVTVPLVLEAGAEVSVAVYDVVGRRVAVLAEGPLGAGRHDLAFDGSSLPAGVYVVRAEVGGGPGASTRRVVIAR